MTDYNPLPNAPPVLLGMDHVTPGPGTYLVLNYNHEGGSPFCTAAQITDRLHDIRTVKPPEERPARLRNFGIVPWSEDLMDVLAEFEKVEGQAWAEYQKVTGQALAEFDKVEGQAWAEFEKVTGQAWAVALSRLQVMSVEEWERLQGGVK